MPQESVFLYNFYVALSGNITYIYFVIKKNKKRTIIFYKDYFQKFFVKQKDKVRDKIIWTFELIEELPRVPETYLKHIEGTD